MTTAESAEDLVTPLANRIRLPVVVLRPPGEFVVRPTLDKLALASASAYFPLKTFAPSPVSELHVSSPFGQVGAVRQGGSAARAVRTEKHWPSSVRQTLVASLSAKRPGRPDPSLVSLVGECDQDGLVSLALSEGIAGPASEKLGPFLTPAQHNRMLKAVRQEAARHLGRLAWLQTFGAAFEEANVTWVVLKGPVLAEKSYGGAVTRGYADLDLMVPARQLRLAINALRDAGAVVADQDWGFLLSIGKGELTMAIHGSPLIDLHWHLIYLRSARERFMISTEELLERRRRIRLRGIEAWTLEATDFAAHIALHASSQGAQRLRRLVDIERTLANQPPDWDVFVQRCRAWRVALPVGAMLNAARHTLGAAVPEEVLSSLARGKLERLLMHELNGWLPAGRLPGGRSVKTGLSRSLRDNLFATSVEFASESWRALGALARGKSRAAGDRRDGDHHPGGPTGFERFMEMVASADCYGHLGKEGHL